MNTIVKTMLKDVRQSLWWCLFLFIFSAGIVLGAPPAVTLNYPADNDSTADPFMDLSFTISADNYPLDVKLYGDTNSPPTDLIYAADGILAETTIPITWNALRLESDPASVGLWHFDENSDTVINDASGSGNNGYFVNGPQWTADGKFGYGVDFDGTDDYITIPDLDNSLDVDSTTGILTMEAWIYPHHVGEGVYHAFLSKRNDTIATAVNYALYLDDNTGALTLYNGTFSPGAGWYESNVVIPANQWSYIVVSLDASEGMLRFYYNGEVKDSIAGAKFGPDHDAELTIGTSRTPSGDRCFDGVIDDVRITKRLLSDDEIARNYGLNRNLHSWQVKAVDALSESTESAIMNFNVGLVLNPVSDASVAEGDNIVIDISASNPDGAPIELTSPDLPDNAVINDNGDGTGTIDFTPAYDQAGNHGVTIYADDGIENVSRAFNLTVTNTNRPPVESDIPDQSTQEGNAFASIDLTAYVNDPDVPIDDEVSWTHSGNIDLLVDITGNVATVTIPDGDWFGEETITFIATDLGGLFDEDAVVFTVTNVNDPPVVDEIVDAQVIICNYLEFGVSSSDIDGSVTAVSATLSPEGDLPTGAAFEDYGDASGLFNWTPDASMVGIYDIRITAVDDSGATGFEDMIITVQSDDNAPQVNLSSPADAATTSDPFMLLTAVLSDETPMTVWIYGGYSAEALDLLSVEEDVIGPTIAYDWNTPVLRPDPLNTIGLWHFDEGISSVMHDAGPSGNDGTITGQLPVWTNDGRFGYAVDLNGSNNYISINHHPSLDVDSTSGAVTIEARVFPHDDGNDDHWRGLVAKRAMGSGTGPCNYQIALNEDGYLCFYSCYTTGIDETGANQYASTIQVPNGQWSYLAVTLDASEGRLRFYRNGTLEDEINDAVFGPAIDCELTIGTASRQLECFDGIIDEVRVTRRALVDFEIASNYSHIGGGVHYWKMVAVDCAGHETSSGIRSFTVTDDNPPDINLLSPENGVVAIYPYMLIQAEAIDESPVDVYVYGDATPSADDLLYVFKNAKSTGINYNWTAAPLEPDPPFTSGLWNFDEGEGTAISDGSLNGNTGTLTNGPVWSDNGRFGYAVDFDGIDDYITIPDASYLDVDPDTGVLTMEAWIYPHTVGGDVYRAFLSKRDSMIATAVNYSLYLDLTDGALTMYNGNISTGYYQSTIIIEANTWTYVAVSLDATEGFLRFYRNGVLEDEISGASFGDANDAELTIGTSRTPTGDRCFDGLVDDVRITKRLLSSDEIADNYILSGDTYFWRVCAHDAVGNISESEIRYFTTNLFVCGDANGDGNVNIGDAVSLIAFIFNEGTAPDPIEAGDANGDGDTNVGDAVYIIYYVFQGGPPPVCP